MCLSRNLRTTHSNAMVPSTFFTGRMVNKLIYYFDYNHPLSAYTLITFAFYLEQL